jgi:hypothetical protein
LNPIKLRLFGLLAVLAAATVVWPTVPGALANEDFSEIPPWLQSHVGDGDGQIAELVLKRARAYYMEKVLDGSAKNTCYFAMDATKPSVSRSGSVARRFYIICEHDMSFRAISSGYGNGRRLPGANFANGRRCAKNFSNAEGSKLTTGGGYVTAETRTSFKGYYRTRGESVPLVRAFVQFEGEGDTANARERAIGGHSAVLLRSMCLRKRPKSPYANEKGYVPYGRLLNYSSGRSNGCTSWTPEDSEVIVKMIKDRPTTVYIYPESRDIEAVRETVKEGKSLSSAGLYWSARCLREIGSPKFWPKDKLEPIIAKYRKARPTPPPRPLPICKSG